jgi:hypothetical protein
MTYIHISQLREILKSGKPVSLKFWKSDGSIVNADNVVSTSSFYKENTVNVKFLNSGERRKIRIVTIFEVNDLEVFL